VAERGPKCSQAPKHQSTYSMHLILPFKPTKVSTSISRPIDYRIDPHVHARQPLPVRVVASASTTAGAGAVVVSLICARTAGAITSSISVIISLCPRYLVRPSDERMLDTLQESGTMRVATRRRSPGAELIMTEMELVIAPAVRAHIRDTTTAPAPAVVKRRLPPSRAEAA